MVVGSIKLMRAENRLKEYAFSFFIEIGCVAPEKALSLMQLKGIGFGVADAGIKYLFKYGFVRTPDDKMYLDVKLASHKISRMIIGMWLFLIIMDAILYLFTPSFVAILIPVITAIFIMVLIPWSIYAARPLSYLKLENKMV